MVSHITLQVVGTHSFCILSELRPSDKSKLLDQVPPPPQQNPLTELKSFVQQAKENIYPDIQRSAVADVVTHLLFYTIWCISCRTLEIFYEKEIRFSRATFMQIAIFIAMCCILMMF